MIVSGRNILVGTLISLDLISLHRAGISKVSTSLISNFTSMFLALHFSESTLHIMIRTKQPRWICQERMCTIVRISLPDEIQGTRGILSQDSLGCGFSLPHGVVATGQLGLSRHTSHFIILRTRNAIIGIRATAKPRTAFFHFRVEHYLTSINLIEHFSRYTTGTLLKSS